MKEFFVGLLVLMTFTAFGSIGVFMAPFFMLLGFFLQIILAVFVFIFAVWALGRVALWGIDRLTQK